MEVVDFGVPNILNLIEDLRINNSEGIKDAFAFAETLDVDSEINSKIERIAKKQCKIDRCQEWVLFHANH